MTPKKSAACFLMTSMLVSVALYSVNNYRDQDDSDYSVTKAPARETKSVLENSLPNIEAKMEDEMRALGSVGTRKEYDDNWCYASELTEDAEKLSLEIYNDWLFSRGYNIEEEHLYETYSLQTLEEMAAQGDFAALEVLSSSRDRATRLNAAELAAVHGSTGTALVAILVDHDTRARQLLESGNEEEARIQAIEALAWREFAALRGDFSHMKAAAYRIHRGKTSVSLEKSDFDLVSQRASEIHTQLNQKRSELNLPPFDDEVPKVVDNLNAFTVSNLRPGNMQGWGKNLVHNQNCIEKLSGQDSNS